jgi:hypothetical protein
MCVYVNVVYEHCGHECDKGHIDDKKCKDFRRNILTGLYECHGRRYHETQQHAGRCPHCELEIMHAQMATAEPSSWMQYRRSAH